MKIVLNADGRIVARHADSETVKPSAYAEYGPVLIGIVDPGLVKQDARGEDSLVVPALEVARDFARAAVKEALDAEAGALLGDYPSSEQTTFAQKAAEARAVVGGGGEAEAPLLAKVAAARGDSLKTLANKIVRKADALNEELALLEARRVAAYAKIDKAKKLDVLVEVEA